MISIPFPIPRRLRTALHLNVPAVVIVATSLMMTPTATAHAAPAGLQRLAIPSYFDPGKYWAQLDSGTPTVKIAIINPDNGPDTKPDCSDADASYAKQVRASESAGITILGYEDTGYTKVPLARAEADAQTYFRCYRVDGIFADDTSSSCAELTYYQSLYKHVRKHAGHHLVTINPGTQTSKCYLKVADIIVNFEGSYEQYKKGYRLPSWVTSTPATRFWQIIYEAKTVKQMRIVVSLSKRREAGYLYVTPDVLPNPYDTLPTSTYWKAELTNV